MCKSAGAAAIAAVLFNAETPAAAEQARVKTGTLTCIVGPSVGAVIASRRRMACRFEARDGRAERYSGTVTRFGLDVGATGGGVMTWSVVVRTRHGNAGALAGHYIGVSAEASLGLGAGAKVLVGGSRRSTMLQPVSALGKTGVNLAAGVAGLSLRYQCRRVIRPHKAQSRLKEAHHAALLSAAFSLVSASLERDVFSTRGL